MNDALIRLLIERASDLRDEAVQVATRARRMRDSAHQTLGSLMSYREESLERAPTKSGTTVSIAQLQVTRQFDAKLVQAIHAQYQEHAARADDTRQHEAVLQDRQRRLTALQALEKRRLQHAQSVALRREQRALDEFATSVAARRRSAREK